MKQLIKRNLLTHLIPLAVVVTAAAVLFVSPALAARHHHADPTVSVNPSPAYVGDSLVFSGCGYAASSNLTLVVDSPFAMSFTGASTDTSGCFSTASSWGYTALMAGSYTVDVYQPTDHHKPSGSLTFGVS